MPEQEKKVKIIQNVDKTIEVMHDAGTWLVESGKNPSKWWQPENMNREFLLQHADASEFYVAFVDGVPAAGMVLQSNERNQSWKSVDKNKQVNAVYIHWLCVDRKYAGTGLPKLMVDFASSYAKARGIYLIRADTNAGEKKLGKIYQKLGFNLVSTEDEGYRITAFYQKDCQ